MKAFRLKIALRFFAILDVMFAERFELITYKNGRQTSKTKFCRKEINEAGKDSKL
jgi:hypothetical protein